MKISRKNDKSFTLLELIIVIIILGVLASLALPRMFNMVDKVKAEEGLKYLNLAHKAVLACMQFGNTFCACHPTLNTPPPPPYFSNVPGEDPIPLNSQWAWLGGGACNGVSTYALTIVHTPTAARLSMNYSVSENASQYAGVAFSGTDVFSSLNINMK